MKCPLCNGTQERLVTGIHALSGMKVTRSEPCQCYLSKIISDKCSLLLPWSESWIPESKIDSRLLKFDPDDLAQCPNYIIKGDYPTFCLSIKGLMMRHWFHEPRPQILFCRAIDVLHDFFVQQKDGTSADLSDTYRYALIVMCMDTEEKNDVLKTVVAQVVYTRGRDRKPTWLYLPDNRPTLSACDKENSPELGLHTASYLKVELKAFDGTVRPSSVNQADAANFGGLAQ